MSKIRIHVEVFRRN